MLKFIMFINMNRLLMSTNTKYYKTMTNGNDSLQLQICYNINNIWYDKYVQII